MKLLVNLLGLPLTNALDFRQPFRLIFDNLKAILFKLFDNAACEGRANAFNCP